MKSVRLLLLALPLVAVCGCSSGGGSGSTPGVPAWEKFRHDERNTGQGVGLLTTNVTATPKSVQIDMPAPAGTPAQPPSAIVSSPALALTDTLYVASEGGTLAAFNPSNLDQVRRITACSVCPDQETLGPMASSPTAYTLDVQNTERTYVLLASQPQSASLKSGRVYVFEDDGTNLTCTACFQPPLTTGQTASFISSPTFMTNGVTGNITAILVGAEINTPGVNQPTGKFYAINIDGSLQWQFPPAGAPTTIGAVNSTPAIGTGSAIYFTAADGNLYSLTTDGKLRFTFPVGAASTDDLFLSSPVTDNAVFVASADGSIQAIAPDGSSTLWQVSPADIGLSASDTQFVASLAEGPPMATTPTPTPTATPTPTGTPPTAATPTPTPVVAETDVYGVTRSGVIVKVDTVTGVARKLPEDPATCPTPNPAIVGPIISSPALSSDGYLIFGDAAGSLHAISTLTGCEAPNWPIQLGAPVRSSPVIDANGIVYIGADNGLLYIVGQQ